MDEDVIWRKRLRICLLIPYLLWIEKYSIIFSKVFGILLFSVSKFQEQSNWTTFKGCVELTQQPTTYSAMDVLGVVPRLTLSSVGVTYADFSTETSGRTGCYYKEKNLQNISNISNSQKRKEVAVNQMSKQHHVKPVPSSEKYMWFFVLESSYIFWRWKYVTFVSQKGNSNQKASHNSFKKKKTNLEWNI